MNIEQTILPVASIAPQPGFNPRRFFDPSKMAEFENSVRAQGIIEPLVVRRVPGEDGKYWLIAGERRWRTASKVGLSDVPVVIRDCDDRTALQIANDENEHRDDISVAEEAHTARRILDLANGDQDEAVKLIGWNERKFKARLALLHAVDPVMDALAERKIKLGHAELLATLPEEKQGPTLATIIERNISVEVLHDQMKRVTVPLASACFNTDGCVGCPFNSTTTRDLFDTHSADAMCSNRTCFNEKTEARLVEIRAEKQTEYPLVFFDREKQASSYTFLLERGNGAVGPEQYEACKSCANFGALISTAPGKEGSVICSTTCFDVACNRLKVKEYAQSLGSDDESADDAEADAGTSSAQTGTPTTKTTKKAVTKKKAKGKAKAAETPPAVMDQYKAFACREGAEAVKGSAHAQDVFTTWAILTQSHDVDGLRDSGSLEDHLDDLWKKSPEELASMRLQVMESLLLKPTKALISAAEREKLAKKRVFIPRRVDGEWVEASQKLVQLTKANVGEKYCLDQALLEAHTKSGLQGLLTELGFAAFYDEKHKDDKSKSFKSLLNKKHPEIVAEVLAAGFDFKGRIPSPLAQMLAEPEGTSK